MIYEVILNVYITFDNELNSNGDDDYDHICEEIKFSHECSFDL